MMVSPVLSLYRPLPGARARIFAFPHAGGGASAFMKLRMALRTDKIELCALQPPGRENRSAEQPHASVEAMALDFAAAIETLSPMPFAFLGHSFGGLSAYLTARLLAARGLAPDHLVVSGSISPVLPRGTGAVSDAGNVRERIVALGGIPDAILADPDLFEMFAAVIQSDMELGDAYCHVPDGPLNCPITVYSGIKDHAAPPALASAWQHLTSHDLQTRNFDGGHFFLYADPDRTAAALVDDLGYLCERTLQQSASRATHALVHPA